jgi:hypothetical protein
MSSTWVPRVAGGRAWADLSDGQILKAENKERNELGQPEQKTIQEAELLTGLQEGTGGLIESVTRTDDCRSLYLFNLPAGTRNHHADALRALLAGFMHSSSGSPDPLLDEHKGEAAAAEGDAEKDTVGGNVELEFEAFDPEALASSKRADHLPTKAKATFPTAAPVRRILALQQHGSEPLRFRSCLLSLFLFLRVLSLLHYNLSSPLTFFCSSF